MQHTVSLKQNHEFRRLYNRGKSAVSPYFAIYCRKTGRDYSRLGITTGLMTAFQQTCREEPTYRADLRMLQYDALYGKGYCYEGEARYRPTEMEMGMVPIEITGMEQRAGDWFILGENFTPYCVVTQNGQLLDTEYEAPWLLRVTEEPNTADYRDLGISVVDKHNEVLSNTE